MTKPLPIVFLAFADPGLNLSRLAEEQKSLTKIFQLGKASGLCDKIVEPRAELDQIVEVFQSQDYKDRISIFHYAGHAGHYKIFLEDKQINTQYFDQFLCQNKSLKLVFLNGCSSKKQAENLLKVGIPVIIATAEDIPDECGLYFSRIFYSGLTQNLSIKDAFDQASAITMSAFSNCFEINRSLSDPDEPTPPKELLWKLLYKKSDAVNWKIKDDLDDPLYNLPLLQHYSLPSKPFISLQSYTENEARIFWGRSHEISKLFFQVLDENSNRLILLYGQSGIGKSSFLDAGLVPRLKSEAEVYYVKRIPEIGIIKSLDEKIQIDNVANQDLFAKLKLICTSAGKKKVIIILDQLEEIVIKNNIENELKNLIQLVSFVRGSLMNIKFILSYRKEFHAEIEAEIQKNNLYSSSCFILPLNFDDIVEIVNGVNRSASSKAHYQVSIENNLAESIANDLLEDTNSPVAPVLQILLTKFWDLSSSDNNPERVFTKGLYTKIKKAGFALSDYINESIAHIKESEPNSESSGLLIDLLFYHTTGFGSAAAHPRNETILRYEDGENIERLIEKCKQFYLLTEVPGVEKNISLGHDTMAPVIRNLYNVSQRPAQKAARLLEKWQESNYPQSDKYQISPDQLCIVINAKFSLPRFTSQELDFLQYHQSQQRAKKNKRQVFSVLLSLGFLALATIGVALWYVNTDRKKKGAEIISFNLIKSANELQTIDPNLSLALLLKADSIIPQKPEVISLLYSLFNNSQKNLFYNSEIKVPFENNVTFIVSPDSTVTGVYKANLPTDEESKLLLYTREGTEIKEIKHEGMEITKAKFFSNKNQIAVLYKKNKNKDSESSIIEFYNYNGESTFSFTLKKGIANDFFILANDKMLLTTEILDRNTELQQDFIVNYSLPHGDIKAVHKTGHEPSIYINSNLRNTVILSCMDSIGPFNYISGKRNLHFVPVLDKKFVSDNLSFFGASSWATGEVFRWSIFGKPILPFDPEVKASFVAISNEGITATSDENGLITERNINGTILCQFSSIQDISNLKFSSVDRKLIVSGANDEGLLIYDSTGKLKCRIDQGNGVTCSSNDEFDNFITAGASHIRFWNLNTRPDIQNGYFFTRGKYEIHINNSNVDIKAPDDSLLLKLKYPVRDIIVKDGNFLILHGPEKYGYTGEEQLLDTSVISYVAKGKIVRNVLINQNLRHLINIPESENFYTLGDDGRVRLYDKSSKLLLTLPSQMLPYSKTDIDQILKAEYVPEKKTLITISDGGILKFWNNTGNLLKTFDFAIPFESRSILGNWRSNGKVFSLTADRKFLTVVPRSGDIFSLNLATEKLDSITLKSDDGKLLDFWDGYLIENGKYFLGINNRDIVLWDKGTKQEITRFINNGTLRLLQDETGFRMNFHDDHSKLFLLPKGIYHWTNTIFIPKISVQRRSKYGLP